MGFDQPEIKMFATTCSQISADEAIHLRVVLMVKYEHCIPRTKNSARV